MCRFLAFLSVTIFGITLVVSVMKNEPIPNGGWFVLIAGILFMISDSLETIQKLLKENKND